MFDFSDAMERLICHIRATCPEFAHVDLDRMVVACMQARSPGAHGVFASVQPLKFEGGSETTVRRGRTYAMPEMTQEGRQILYIIYFALPRFMNMKFEAKLATVFHELYHISPQFNGDIRRFKGKYYAHGKSRKAYNELVGKMAREYLAMPGADEHTEFLRSNFKTLDKQSGGVTGLRIRSPRPRVI
ncbi:MAG TPA: putative metallopeptidase [Armatimonadota bacterium]|nr:putative metallopeptidase [Armatimonadota bacterium]